MSRDATYIRMIHTGRWLKLRKAVLTAAPLCARCMRAGKLTPAAEVHHVTPVETAISPAEMERLMFDPSNLQGLCHACHVETHKEMGKGGRAETRKRNEARVKESVRRFFGGDGD